MANYTLQITSNEANAEFKRNGGWNSTAGDWEHDISSKFTFILPDLTGLTIKSVSITAPIIETYRHGGYGNFELKIASYTVLSLVDSTTTVWGASNLNLAGNRSDTVTLELNPTSVPRYESVSAGSGNYTLEGRRLGRGVLSVVVEGEFTESPIEPIDGQRIPRSLENTFSWSPTIVQGEISSQHLYWKASSDATYTEIALGTDDTSYTFPANTFSSDTINWYVKGVDDAGNEATSPIQTVDVGIIPTVSIAYPLNVNIRNGNVQIFTWEMAESIATGQKTYELKYKKTTENNWITITETSANQFHEFPANTFDTATYEWKLKVTNNDDISTDYVSASFVAIGTTSAPDITNITNSSIPTITWQTSSQDTFELEIYSGDKRIYTSGVQVGKNIRTFTPNLMLDDGNYIVKMRSMNEYGYFTEWADYSFVLAPSKPDEVSCMAYANAYHGINIATLDETTNILYVLRRVFGETKWNILGKIHSNETFTDNTVMTGIKYEYSLRNYQNNAGFTDSTAVSIVIEHLGSLIYDGNEFVELYKTEDEQIDIVHTPSKTYAYSYAIGRKYPVRESSEWISHTTSISCFVKFEEYEKLEQFYEGNDDLWFKGDNFSFKCSIDSIQIKETLLGKGYSISIGLSRTDEDEVNLIE